ncbi:hypothetical protein ACLKA6_002746 [Drosophila palustris]
MHKELAKRGACSRAVFLAYFKNALMASHPTTFEVRNLLEHATQTRGSFKFRFRYNETFSETETEKEIERERGTIMLADEWKNADKIRVGGKYLPPIH